ncbi:MAG: hypothetical protein ABIM89_15985 [Mycobacteriales bacterium]
MSRFKHTMVVAAALMTAAAVVAVPAHADEANTETKVEAAETEKTEKTTPVEKDKPAERAKPTCTADELAAHLAAEQAEQAAKAKRKAAEQAAAHAAEKATAAEHAAQEHLRATGVEESERAAEEKAHATQKAAKACARAKQEDAHQKARVRKFQGIGIVDSTDAAAGTVTVRIKGGSKDLHRRTLAIKVTSETRIQLDGETVALAGLVKGTFVSVHGVRHEGELVAGKINAAAPGVD